MSIYSTTKLYVIGLIATAMKFHQHTKLIKVYLMRYGVNQSC